MKTKLKTGFVFFLAVAFVASAIFCCCLTAPDVQAEEPAMSCHQTEAAPETNSQEVCECDQVSALYKEVQFQVSAVESAEFLKISALNSDLFFSVSQIKSYQDFSKHRLKVFPTIFQQNPVLRL